MTATLDWPLPPLRCAAPEPPALCPAVHRWDVWTWGGLWCGHGDGIGAVIDWRGSRPRCPRSTGRCAS